MKIYRRDYVANLKERIEWNKPEIVHENFPKIMKYEYYMHQNLLRTSSCSDEDKYKIPFISFNASTATKFVIHTHTIICKKRGVMFRTLKNRN